MVTLIYDGSFEGLLTCIYEGFYIKNNTVNSIYNNSLDFTPSFLDTVLDVKTDAAKFEKVKNAIISKIDMLSLKKIYVVYLSNEENKEMLIYKYLKTAFSIGHDVHMFLNLDEVRNVDSVNKRVNLEVHLLRGFIRFNCINNKFLYSEISPDNDILEFIAKPFKDRYINEYWIINDVTRHKAVIYDKHEYKIIAFSKEDSAKFSNYSDEYEDLWKEYFKATDIKERKNLKLQKRMMPKRYWKHILETQSK